LAESTSHQSSLGFSCSQHIPIAGKDLDTWHYHKIAIISDYLGDLCFGHCFKKKEIVTIYLL
jgi:hypothetical protein